MIIGSLVNPCFLRIFLIVYSEVWSVVIIVTTLLSIHFYIWNFISSLIHWIVLNSMPYMLLIYFGDHPIISLAVTTTVLLSPLNPINTRGKLKVIHTHHILLCISIGEWLNENDCNISVLITIFIWISNYCIQSNLYKKLFLHNGFPRTCSLPSHDYSSSKKFVLIYLRLHHHLINIHCTPSPYRDTLLQIFDIINNNWCFWIPPHIKR